VEPSEKYFSPAAFQKKFGLCQWFHFQDKRMVDATLSDLDQLRIRNLRTGISWADYHRRGGEEWYDYQMQILADAGLNVLLAIWHTPPSIAEGGLCSGPPRRLRDYADFIARVIERYSGQFDQLEFWNEPNNRLKWNYRDHDKDWWKFSEMVGAAAYWAKQCKMQTILGGIIPVDPEWLNRMSERGVLDYIDIIAIHAFPGMWSGESYWWDWPQHWHGWDTKVQCIRPQANGRPIWVTETGYATCLGNSPRLYDQGEQTCRLIDALCAPIERVYWYCVRDIPYHYPCIEMTEDGGRVDHREYHLGLTAANGKRKPAWFALRKMMQEGLSHSFD
jgi:CDP-paratose 2-epimerase